LRSAADRTVPAPLPVFSRTIRDTGIVSRRTARIDINPAIDHGSLGEARVAGRDGRSVADRSAASSSRSHRDSSAPAARASMETRFSSGLFRRIAAWNCCCASTWHHAPAR